MWGAYTVRDRPCRAQPPPSRGARAWWRACTRCCGPRTTCCRLLLAGDCGCACVAVARASAHCLPTLTLTCGRTCVLATADALHVPQVPAGPYSRHSAARQQVSHDLVRVTISLSNVHINLLLLLLHSAFSWPGASDPAPYSCHTYLPSPVTPVKLLLSPYPLYRPLLHNL